MRIVAEARVPNIEETRRYVFRVLTNLLALSPWPLNSSSIQSVTRCRHCQMNVLHMIDFVGQPRAFFLSMRDDLHRGAPVAPKWRSLMRAVASDADWRVEGPGRARVALVADMRGHISPSVLKEVRDTIESSLPGLREPVRWQHRPRSEVDRLLQDHAQLAILDGRDGPSGTAEVMRNAVEEFADRHVQAMRAHVLTKDRRNAGEFVARTRATLAPAIQGVVQELALGSIPAKPPAAKPFLDLDEDLRGSRK